MKRHQPKNRDQTMEKTKGDKKSNRNDNQTIRKRGRIKRKHFDKNTIKGKELKIKVLTRELLASILSYLMLAP
jgi:hypothetical protein